MRLKISVLKICKNAIKVVVSVDVISGNALSVSHIASFVSYIRRKFPGVGYSNSARRALKRASVAGVNFDIEAMTRSIVFSFMLPLLE